MFTCKKAAELLLDFIDDGLTPEMRDAMGRHLAECKACVALLETYKSTSKLCRSLVDAQCPAEVAQRLKAFLREQIHKRT